MSKKYTKEQLFESLPVGRVILTLTIPTIMSALVTVLYSLADTFFVGLLNDPIQSAAVTLATPVLLAFYGVNNLFGVGSSSMMSRALGRKDLETVYNSAAFGFYGTLFTAFLFSFFCFIFNEPLLNILGADAQTALVTKNYLFYTVVLGAIPTILNVVLAYMVRSEGAALHASIGTMSGCIINIILDPIFILPFGFDLKAQGAALATFISNCIALSYFLIYLYTKRKTTCVKINYRYLKLKKSLILSIFAVGIPAAIQNLLNVLSNTIMNNLSAIFGSTALAAMGICTKVNMVPMQIAFGISQGIMPFVSYNFASGNIKRMKKGFIFALKIALTFLSLSAAFIFLFSPLIMKSFINEANTVNYGISFLKGLCLGLPFLGFDFMAIGVFQAVGMGKFSLIFAILRKLVFEIPLLYLLNHFLPLYGLAYSQAVTEFLLTIISCLVLIKFFKHHQNKNI